MAHTSRAATQLTSRAAANRISAVCTDRLPSRTSTTAGTNITSAIETTGRAGVGGTGVVAGAELVGDVDAVALENVPATGDPASSLAGPLPIGLLDGRRASVSRWMAMLTMDGGRR